MPKFGNESAEQLQSCHYKIREVLTAAIRFIDFSVLSGYRNEAQQNAKFDDNHSKVRYPYSKHNVYPSLGVDIAPWPIDWQDRERFTYLAGIVVGIAFLKGYTLRWGGDWDQDTQVKDNDFDDLGHFELVID